MFQISEIFYKKKVANPNTPENVVIIKSKG